jgi:hypothetical protein
VSGGVRFGCVLSDVWFCRWCAFWLCAVGSVIMCCRLCTCRWSACVRLLGILGLLGLLRLLKLLGSLGLLRLLVSKVIKGY